MIETVLAKEGGSPVHVGVHEPLWHFLGMTFNGDTIISTAVAGAIVIGLAFFLRAKVTSRDVPGGVQLFFEAVTVQMRQQIESTIGMRIAPFVLPLAVTIFVFILISNWLSVLPLQYGEKDGAAGELLNAPAADVNFVYALALFVFIAYHAAGARRHGLARYPWKVAKGHVKWLLPINLVEEIAKPISLALRLFGNIFAGGILVALIAMFPWYVQWAPNAVWKTFDLFVGLIQAFIFSLLTVLYFSQSMEGSEH